MILKFSDLSKKYLIHEIKKILGHYPGKTPVVLYFIKENNQFGASRNLWVALDDNLIRELRKCLGNQNVEVR